jgi:hypothetical protein
MPNYERVSKFFDTPPHSLYTQIIKPAQLSIFRPAFTLKQDDDDT